MIVYAESSAVLTWLIGEAREATVRPLLADAERVVASTLTTVECARALARGVITERLDPVADDGLLTIGLQKKEKQFAVGSMHKK